MKKLISHQKADCFMVENLLNSYISKTELEPHSINIEDNNLSAHFEPLVKDLLKERIFTVKLSNKFFYQKPERTFWKRSKR